jgi:ElaA protein
MNRIEIKHFHDLSRDELYQILALRVLVFVVGQKITAEPEIDGLDPQCSHAMLWTTDADGSRRVIGTARLFTDDEPVVVGRVAIHPDFQRRGLGSELMQAVQAHLDSRSAELHAQAHLEQWYRSLGWRRVGEPFVEADIPHVMMRFDAGPGSD